MKKRIVAFLSLATVLFTGIVSVQTVQASDVNNPFELPSTFSDNAYADEGDFLVWKNSDTYEWYHTQFVQSKNMLAEISCTQHTPNYFNVNFNSRVDSTTFDTNKGYIVDMP